MHAYLYLRFGYRERLLTLLVPQSHSGTRSAVNAVVAPRHIPMVAS